MGSRKLYTRVRRLCSFCTHRKNCTLFPDALIRNTRDWICDDCAIDLFGEQHIRNLMRKGFIRAQWPRIPVTQPLDLTER